ncbi:hypothetical protein BU198_26695 [Streptomyces sp. CBMA156]|nr:hypothetical protein [Streptomyces sp. CBMA156]
MRKNSRAPHRARRLAPAVALTAALVAGGAVTAAPAFATAGPFSLTVHAPAVIGAAGGPVEFTEHIGNPGDQGSAVVLEFSIETGLGTPPHALSLAYHDDSLGAWRTVDLEERTEADRTVYSGATDKLYALAGGTDIKVRLGVPMGLPHDGASNGGVGPDLTFRTGVKGWWLDSPIEPPLNDTHVIKVDAISNSVSGVPATAVAGGAPIEFDAVLDNPTPSAYTNLGNVLFTDRHARVEVRGDDGAWTVLAPVTGAAEPPAGFYLDGRNSSAAPNSSTTRRVRVGYPADTPLGTTELNPCVFVNEGDLPFRGTTMCSRGAKVQVVAPAPKPTSRPATTTAQGIAAREADENRAAPSGSHGSHGSHGSNGSGSSKPAGGAPAARPAARWCSPSTSNAGTRPGCWTRERSGSATC